MKDEKSNEKPKRLPRFRSIEEEAEFWDTHDSTEFEHLFRPTRVRFAEHVEHILSVPLDPRVIDRLARMGRESGLGLNKVVAQLIAEGLERLDTAKEKPAAMKGKQDG